MGDEGEGGRGVDMEADERQGGRESVAMQIKRLTDRHIGETLICTRSSCSDKAPHPA